MKVTFTETSMKEYMNWLKEDKKTLLRINELIKDIQRHGFTGDGIGKAEILKGSKGFSRRIDKTNRLVYTGDTEGNLVILSCAGHYED